MASFPQTKKRLFINKSAAKLLPLLNKKVYKRDKFSCG
jgi:hypothetical protein